MVGDIFLQEALPENSELAAVTGLLQAADVALGNLETPVSERGTPTEKWVNMRMPPDLLSDVVDMGFDVLTLANNHMMDFGEEAFFDTLKYLRARNLRYVGAGADIDAAWRAEVVTVAGGQSGLPGRIIDAWSGISRKLRRPRRRANSRIGVLSY